MLDYLGGVSVIIILLVEEGVGGLEERRFEGGGRVRVM